MSASWFDFTDAPSNVNIIPKGTLAKVRVTIRPGGYDNPEKGWTGGYATRGSTGAVYLNAEYTVLDGQYAGRKIWSLIGLHSEKGPTWAEMGRSFVRNMLCSARGVSAKDKTPAADEALRITGFHDLDGLEFVARIDVGTDTEGQEKNEIRTAITPGHRDYAQLMGRIPGPRPAAASGPGHPAPGHAAPSRPATGRPQWAQ